MEYIKKNRDQMYNKVLTKIIFPTIHQFFPDQKKTFEYYQFLRKTQYWTLEGLKKLQKKKLRHLMKYVYSNIPYYHDIFRDLNLKPDEIKEISDLKKLPYLTKEDIINNFNKLKPKNTPLYEVSTSFTGGTTGKRMKFLVDQNWDAWNMAAAYREWEWAGYELGDKTVYLWGSLDDLNLQKQIKVKLFNMIQRIQMLNAYNITEETLQDYINTLKKFQPKIINAYASAANILGSYLSKNKTDQIHPKAILTSCETLHDFQRKNIENGFQSEVFDYYSARDTSLHAAECPEHMGYHTSMENAIVEFIKNNEIVSSGELGELTITDLSNYAMPFIRYKIGDIGIPTDETCSCGRTLPLIKNIVGRTTDMIVTTEGKYIPGLYFIHIFDTESIKAYQLIQKTKETYKLKIVKSETFSQDELLSIEAKIKDKCGNVDIEVEEVNEIPLTKSGKYRFIISEVKHEF